MGLVLQLVKTSISADCNTLVISDSTGVYNVSINPGGYGAPNPARNTLYMILFCNLRDSSGNRTPVTIPSYNYNTVTSWTITLSQDGWYELYAFSTIVWAGGTTYAQGNIVFDVASNSFYVSQVSSNTGNAVTNVAYWLPTTNILDFIAATAASQANAYDVTLNDVELCRSVKCKANALFQAVEQDDMSINTNDCTIQPYEKIRLRVEAALVANAEFIYSDAAEFIDDLNTLCAKCNCAC